MGALGLLVPGGPVIVVRVFQLSLTLGASFATLERKKNGGSYIAFLNIGVCSPFAKGNLVTLFPFLS